ncbi:MAG: bile acid:sodium symporter family protein [Rubrivivax sp.]|nr:bile acid:sodium symporter family protein [Rubrivivax sp.]
MNPMPSPVITVGLPLALAVIMLYLGLTLRWSDFRSVLRRPRSLAIGLLGQVVLVPLLGFAVAAGSGLPAALAVGLMVLAACPGGVSSGLLTHLARGDVALSIVLTAVSSVIAMLSLPLVLDLALRWFSDSSLQTELPLGSTVRRIFLLTTVPVLLGMALRAWKPAWAERIQPAGARLATGLFVIIVLATFWNQREAIWTHLGSVGVACALLNVAVLALGWTLSQACGLERREAIAVTTECGLQNSALGIYVTLELLREPLMSVPSVVYALLMNLGAIAFVIGMRRTFASR